MFESVEAVVNPKPLEKITTSDISREMPGVGETEIIMQRHEKYIRDLEHERSGSLESEEAKKAYNQSVEILKSKFDSIPEEERKNVDILVIASNTEYGKAKGKRSFETASEVVKGIQEVLEKYGLDKNQLLNSNSKTGEGDEKIVPVENENIQEPRMFKDSPEFVEYLKGIYGDQTQDFWKAFEEDEEKAVRKELGAEGPEHMKKRYNDFVKFLKEFSEHYHEENKGRRLIIWTVSHYDTISPFIKNEVTKTDPNEYLPVDYGSGISLNIDSEGEVTSNIRGVKYDININ